MSMKIKTATFVKSAVVPEDYPDTGVPEIAFVGRSNVGKSSLINKMVQRKALAKTSSTPGKTRLINFFLVNGLIGFVDLPGYGYAKVSKTERESWGVMIDRFLSRRRELKGVVLIQDIRRDQADMDRKMIEMIRRHGIPLIIVLTKADKFTRGKQNERVKKIISSSELADRKPVLFSSQTGAGRDELWEAIGELIGIETDDPGMKERVNN